MNLAADTVRVFVCAAAEPLGMALAGALLLWVVVKLRRMSESWRGAQRISTRPVARRPRREAEAARSTRAASISLIVGALFLFGATAYLSLRMIPEAFQYFELKKNLPRGQQVIRFATWRDPALRCPGDEPLGVQFGRLFVLPQIYLLDVRWDAVPPRYEVAVSGRTPLVEGSIDRYVELLVDVGVDGMAELRDATLLGESHALEPVRRLLAGACERSG